MARKSKKVKEKVEKQWTEDDMQNALHHKRSTPGASIRGTATQFGVSESTLRWRLEQEEKANGEFFLKKAGRKCVFDENVEKELAECIAVACNAGFSPSMIEIQVRNLIFT